jgi:hypothetical protein
MTAFKILTLAAGTAALFGVQNSKFEYKEPAVQRTVVQNVDKPSETSIKENKIQVALLLDTSNSMDGLIDQAKSRLWNIVNTLTTLKYNGKAPQVEIALYEYGNDGLRDENYIRQVTP